MVCYLWVNITRYGRRTPSTYTDPMSSDGMQLRVVGSTDFAGGSLLFYSFHHPCLPLWISALLLLSDIDGTQLSGVSSSLNIYDWPRWWNISTEMCVKRIYQGQLASTYRLCVPLQIAVSHIITFQILRVMHCLLYCLVMCDNIIIHWQPVPLQLEHDKYPWNLSLHWSYRCRRSWLHRKLQWHLGWVELLRWGLLLSQVHFWYQTKLDKTLPCLTRFVAGS